MGDTVNTLVSPNVDASNLVQPASASQQFSRASVFGIFLTLQICQLTQPYGSLLYRETGGWLWRCNPIASFIEFCIIAKVYFGLLKDFIEALKQERRLHTLRKNVVPQFRIFYQRMSLAAGALLLLRGVGGDKDDHDLIEHLRTGEFTDKKDRDRNSASSSHSTKLIRSAYAENPSERTGADRAHSGVIDEPLPIDQRPISTSSSPISPQQQGLKRSGTSQLEEGLTCSAPNVPLLEKKSGKEIELLRYAFGPSALSHREKRIDLVTTFAVIVTLVKVVAIRQTGWFKTFAIFTILGWFAVQSAVLLFHARKMTDRDMRTALHYASNLDANFSKSNRRWHLIYIGLHIHLMCYSLSGMPSPTDSDFVSLLLLHLVMALVYFLTFLFTFLFFAFPPMLYAHFFSRLQSPPADFLEDPTLLYELRGMWSKFFRRIFRFLPKSVVIVVEVIMRKVGHLSTASVMNFSITGVVFFWYLYNYDAKGTSKPNWIDWLG
jgi:hypothetical protein